MSVIKDRAILIVGTNDLQNELIASFLEIETGVKCFILEDFAKVRSEHLENKERDLLLLYDCTGRGVDGCMEACMPLMKNNSGACFLCLFNLKRRSGLEKALLQQGIRGFFYSDEPLRQISQGVQAVLDGQIWVSRQIMVDLAITSIKKVNKNNPPHILSHREADILSLILEGATNERIAGKLDISKHTVKTHLSNIFRKINARSRFQAAHWAARNL